MAGRPTHDLAERVAIGFQNPTTQLSGVAATVLEEVALGPMNLGLPVHETLQRTREALGLLRIEHLADRPPLRLSGGQGQLVAIASLLAMRPRHVVLDEPTAQLDPEGTRLVGEALRSLAATGTALLVAEHKTDLLDGLCDRALADGGRIVLGTAVRCSRTSAWSLGRRTAGSRPARPRNPRSRARSRGRPRVIELEDLGYVYPEGTRALEGVDLATPTASGSRSSARTGAASRRWFAT
jgi:energy-coupling factor transporter ATP-binding protein EcfA2